MTKKGVAGLLNGTRQGERGRRLGQNGRRIGGSEVGDVRGIDRGGEDDCSCEKLAPVRGRYNGHDL